MGLIDQVMAAFEPAGRLSQAIPTFVPRAGQTEMAVAVAQTIDTPHALVVEAGTGVGKTYAYLVPVLLSGERAVLSTATKTLQDQLFHHDLPRLMAALGLNLRTALLKGRSSYLCLHRLERALEQAWGTDTRTQHELGQIRQWATQTTQGDLAELAGLDERSAVWPLVSSTRENCLGSLCPKFRACHVNLARREALAADVVVVNHHLFFADLAVRESGMAELLPSSRVLVFDEAHQLNPTGVQFLGLSWSSAQAMDLSRDLLAVGLSLARGWSDWPALAQALQRAVHQLRLCVPSRGVRLRWDQPAPERVAPADWAQAMQTLQTALEPLQLALEPVLDFAPDFVRLMERVRQMRERLALLAEPCAANSVRWVEADSALRLIESPLDIAPAMQARLLGAPGADGKSWVFTSATLGDDSQLRWFTEPCGLTQARTLQVQSPFDHHQQAALYVPTQLGAPGEAEHSLAVAQLALQAARQLGGRTLVLTTSLRALEAIGGFIQNQLQPGEPLTLLVQGSGAKSHLTQRFREGSSQGRSGCILVASASFWQGIDIPGDSLQLVVIDKLPFSAPDDPLVQARAQRLRLQGRSPFNEDALPEAAVALKQGVGRLIRHENDRGVLVICDSRLRSKSYGKRLLRALPAMRELPNEAALWHELGRIAAQNSCFTTVSTTAPVQV